MFRHIRTHQYGQSGVSKNSIKLNELEILIYNQPRYARNLYLNKYIYICYVYIFQQIVTSKVFSSSWNLVASNGAILNKLDQFYFLQYYSNVRQSIPNEILAYSDINSNAGAPEDRPPDDGKLPLAAVQGHAAKELAFQDQGLPLHPHGQHLFPNPFNQNAI